MTIPDVTHHPQILDGPSHSVLKDGRQEWRMRGLLHRLDGPAVIDADGSQEWYVDGKIHRSDGPAILRTNDSQYWCVDGKLHRLDGPAVIQANRPEEWWIDGHNISRLSAHAKLMYIRAYSQIHSEAA